MRRAEDARVWRAPLSLSPPGARRTSAPRDERYFASTGFRVDDDAAWAYVVHRGGVPTFGYLYLVEVASEEEVRALRPDTGLLRRVDTRGVMVTSRAARAGYDFVSRFFAPRLGLDEDWVTGSAHCCLGPFWAERLGEDALVGHQASARGGTVRVRVAGERVHLAGRAVTVSRGEMLVDLAAASASS